MRRTAEEAETTRRELLDAALVLFARRGWSGTTFENVAAQVGRTRGAVHHHFQDKDALLLAVLTEKWAEVGEVILAPLDDLTREPEQRLRAFLAHYLRLLSEDETARSLAVVTSVVAPGARARSQARGLADQRVALDGWRARLRGLLAEDRPRLRDGLDIDSALFVVMNFVLGATLTVATLPEEHQPPRGRHPAVVDSVVAGLLDEPRA